MEPLVTLYECEPAPDSTLTPALATYYAGGLRIQQGREDGLPYVVANFVETLDGVVSYNAVGQTGGGIISGGNKQDQMVMGILRSLADAVIFGTGSLRHDANHVHIPSSIYPKLASEYETLWTLRGKQEALPMSVVVSASGDIDLTDATFHMPELRKLIATTSSGHERLMQHVLPANTDVRVVQPLAHELSGGVSPRETLALLAREYGVRVVLYEGGPTLFASFLAHGLIDELFLTLSPRIAGRVNDLHRLALVEGFAFPPAKAPQATLLSVKLAGNHLLLRYRFR